MDSCMHTFAFIGFHVRNCQIMNAAADSANRRVAHDKTKHAYMSCTYVCLSNIRLHVLRKSQLYVELLEVTLSAF